MPTPTLRTTCPRDCYDACGIVLVPRDGRTPIVRGDPDHPVSRGKLCAKCSTAYNGVFLDPAARVTTPLRRSGPKGTGSFEPISWDEAAAEVAAHLRPLAAGGAATAVLTAHYTGTFAMIGFHFPLRLAYRLGATDVDPDTICNKAGHVALEYLFGTSLDGFDPRSVADAASVLVWGANPSASAPHQDEHWLGEAPCPVIVVDPLRTPTAARADIHLQLRPGSDAALAFGMLHVLDRDGLADRAWLTAHAVGGDELLSIAAGCDPAWTESATGVPAALVEEAARRFGAGPSLLWIGQGLQRQPRGGNVVRAVASLPAVTGALGRPGGGFLYLNGEGTRGIDGAYLAAAHLARPDAEAPVSHLDLVERLEDPERSRALICWNINIVGSNPQQARLRRALAREDLFTVVVDPFPTDTTDYADVVLPAATFLEQDDIVASYFHHSLSPQVRLLDPPGEALPNSEIFRRLAAAMGYDEPELYEPDRHIIGRMLADTGVGLDFDQLARAGTVWPSPEVRL
ncbi:MAG: molybdopterin-dependent oxidoreductase, partial [Acidimicrobiales bacterium]